MISKKLLLGLLIVVLIPFKMQAEWVSLSKNKAANSESTVTLLSDNSSSTVIKVDLSGFDVRSFIAEGKTYQSIDLLTDIFSTSPGSPELPYFSKILAIPDQGGVSVEVIELGDVQTFENIYLPPARESWYEGKPMPAYNENTKVYQSDEVYPSVYASVEPPSVFRDFRIARVSIYPMRYYPGKQKLETVSSITIRINYGGGTVVNPKTSAKKAITPSFGKIYRSSIFNYQSVLDNLYGGKEEGEELMLCIMPDLFVDSFQEYADWKRQSGTNIHITSFSDIGANANNPDIIKDHISEAYFDWDTPPTYVLIIGDNGVFPKKIVSYPDYSFPNEDYFVELEGDDYFPELMIGRFTNQGDYRMQVMINKFELYERYPYVDETDWFKHATCCSNNAYASQVGTKRFTASVMVEDGGFTVDTLMSDGTGWGGSGCTMNVNDVIQDINEGRSYLNYRGEGWYSGWSASCYGFDADDVSGLSNSEKFTFVTSIGCGVAGFHANGGNCFGEEWVQLGSISSPRGGVAFIGPTSNTHTTYNNRIDKGIYVGMFQEGMDTPGQALLRGKLYMYNVFGNDFWVEYHYRIFCVLGDPSIHIWKDVPLEVNVDHETSITVGNNQLEFAITYASSGQPVPNARLCLTGDDIFLTTTSDSLTGLAYIDIMPDDEQTLVITVCGGDVYPYQGNIEVTQPQELIEPAGDPLIVDLDGNSDGLVNPNENCEITYTLKNWGTLTANNLEASLSSTNPEVQILSTTPVSFGNLNPGESFTGDPFQFYVNPDCPIGEIITMQLHVSSNTTTWDYDFNVEVKGCRLTFNSYVVNDEGTGNTNYRMDPGETVRISLSILNEGDDIAPDVVSILQSNDQYISIIDSIGTFGSIATSDLAMNVEDYFIVSVASNCPSNYLAAFSVKLNTQNGNYPYEANPEFDLPVSLPVHIDYTGPDAYGYYAYTSTDLNFEQSPIYNWVEIEDIGTEINVPNTSDYTESIYLPFTLKYYGIDYGQLRISTDGWIAFGGGPQIAPNNASIPSNDNVSSMAAVFWDDLYEDEIDEGSIYYYYDEDNNRFIVEWDSITHNDVLFEFEHEVFQAILLDPDFYQTETGDGEIIFQYKNVDEIESNTVGIENHTQNIGLQYTFNTNYDPTAIELSNELAIKFTTEPPFVPILTSIGSEGNGNSSNQDGYTLGQNRPNPFSSHTWINYSLPINSHVALQVYNIKGELVRTLHNGNQLKGMHVVKWNGKNDMGSQVDSGVYFYRIKTEAYVKTMKMFLLK